MKILIIQTGFLGDIILSTPVITGVGQIYKDASIVFLTTPAGRDLLENDPDIDEVIVYDKRGVDKGLSGIIRLSKKLNSYGFDRVYSLHKSFRTSIMIFLTNIVKKTGFKKSKLSFVYNTRELRDANNHDALRNLSILSSQIDISLIKQDLRLFPPGDEYLDDQLLNLRHEDYILFSPGSAWKTKMWHTLGYNEAAKFFEDRGKKIVISGSKEEIDICNGVSYGTNALNLAGKIDLNHLKFLISNAKLVVCNDSMALHMASALKTPCVAIFCSTIPEFGYGPWKNRSIVVEKKLPCRPCGRHGHTKCPKNTDECMRISSKEVIKACLELLGEN